MKKRRSQVDPTLFFAFGGDRRGGHSSISESSESPSSPKEKKSLMLNQKYSVDRMVLLSCHFSCFRHHRKSFQLDFTRTRKAAEDLFLEVPANKNTPCARLPAGKTGCPSGTDHSVMNDSCVGGGISPFFNSMLRSLSESQMGQFSSNFCRESQPQTGQRKKSRSNPSSAFGSIRA